MDELRNQMLVGVMVKVMEAAMVELMDEVMVRMMMERVRCGVMDDVLEDSE